MAHTPRNPRSVTFLFAERALVALYAPHLNLGRGGTPRARTVPVRKVEAMRYPAFRVLPGTKSKASDACRQSGAFFRPVVAPATGLEVRRMNSVVRERTPKPLRMRGKSLAQRSWIPAWSDCRASGDVAVMANIDFKFRLFPETGNQGEQQSERRFFQPDSRQYRSQASQISVTPICRNASGYPQFPPALRYFDSRLRSGVPL